MPYKANEPRRHKIPKARYRVQNWPEYDRALQQRGSLTVWVTPEALAAWQPPRTGQRGRPRHYSEVAIETGHLLRLAFGRPGGRPRACCARSPLARPGGQRARPHDILAAELPPRARHGAGAGPGDRAGARGERRPRAERPRRGRKAGWDMWRPLWAGVALAGVGVWLMTGARLRGFGAGETLGLACALLFSLYILAVNAAVKHESPWRITAAQFAIVGFLCLATCLWLPGGRANLSPSRVIHILALRTVWVNLSLLTVFPTLIAFGLLTFFQPRIDPTRAALIYLAEPVFTAIYAAIAAGHRVGRLGLIGAALILVANALVEILGARQRDEPEERVVLVD